jgi:hypothetical protein
VTVLVDTSVLIDYLRGEAPHLSTGRRDPRRARSRADAGQRGGPTMMLP